MENRNFTRLTCNDLQRFEKIMKDVPIKNLDADFDDGMVILTSRNTIPLEEIKGLSKQYPDLIFAAEYYFDRQATGTLHIWRYKNGEEISEVLEPEYTITAKDHNIMENEKRMMGSSWNAIFDKAIQVFRRIDIVKQDEKDNKFIDFISGITLTVEDNNYKMQLSKSHSDIEIKCWEKEEVVTYKLVPVGTSRPF